MKTLTLKKIPITERLLERREQFFGNVDCLTDEQVKRLSSRWHAIANRYQKMVGRVLIRSLEGAEN